MVEPSAASSSPSIAGPGVGGRPAVHLLAPISWPLRDLLQHGFADLLRPRAALVVHTLMEDLAVLTARFPEVEFRRLSRYAPGDEARRRREHVTLLHDRLSGKDYKFAYERTRQPFVHRWVSRLRQWRALRGASWAALRQAEAAEYAALDAPARGDAFDALFAHGACVISTASILRREEWPLLRAAARVGAPRMVCFGWDNLLTKGRMPVAFDRYCLWSESMREDLRRYDPTLPAPHVRIVGAHPFDMHVRGDRPARAEFAARCGLDPAQPFILWGGCAAGVMAGEWDEVGRLAEEVAAGRLPPVYVLVRLHPKADEAAYRPLVTRFPFVRLQPSAGRGQGDVEQWLPDEDDLRMMRGALAHAALCITFYSTLTLDALFYDLPVINPGYDTEPQRRLAPGASERAWTYPHYARVSGSGAVRLPRTRAALYADVRAYLGDRSLEREARRQLREQLCGPDDGRAVPRLAELALELLALPRSEAEAFPVPAGSAAARTAEAAGH